MPKLSFLTDEDVPDSVGRVLLEAGHEVARVRDVMLTGSADKVVAAAARENGRILVTHNYRDFRRVVREALDATNRRIDRLSWIELECGQPMAASRISQLLPMIELAMAGPRDRSEPGIRISITRIGFRMANV